MDYLLLLIGLVIGALIGFLAARQKKNTSESSSGNELNDLKVENGTLKGSLESTNKDLEENKKALSDLREKHSSESKSAIEWREKHNSLLEKLDTQKEDLSNLQEKFTKDFELVANKILEEKSSKFTEQNKENIGEILTPLKERISEFQKKVEDNNLQGAKRNSALSEQLKMLKDLNQEITQETKSLTQALRGDSKTQGNWGEMHLEAILGKAGLQKDIHYSKETNLKTEDGSNQRLDYIINLPDGKNLILDSKVSLTAYSNYHDTENEGEQKSYLKQHLDSILGHIKLLSDKNYQKLYDINTPDYVIMFIANEPALTLALKEDQTLFEKALDKNIVLVSTSTLLATLRTISYIWKQDSQNKNAEEIARQAGALYDKFVGFTDDLVKLGAQLKTATGTYEDSMNKLTEGKGNLVGRIDKLKALGVNPSKNIDQRLVDRSDD